MQMNSEGQVHLHLIDEWIKSMHMPDIRKIALKMGLKFQNMGKTQLSRYPRACSWHYTATALRADFALTFTHAHARETLPTELDQFRGRKETKNALEHKILVTSESTVSRRELQTMVAMARHDLNILHRQNLRRIHWNVLNVAWSIDPCEYGQRDETGTKVSLNHMQDLASRYKFNPMTGDIPCGEEIYGYLVSTFNSFGAPLFFKRDNGGNLNHQTVNDVLADYFVMPVNSPVHYPPYNGAIEQTQAELKTRLPQGSRTNQVVRVNTWRRMPPQSSMI
jgi:hypothetical protein